MVQLSWYSVRVYSHRAIAGAGAASLGSCLDRFYWFIAVSFRPSESGSIIASGNKSNGYLTHFSSGIAWSCSGFLLIQLLFPCVLPFQNVVCFLLKIKIMPPIRNRLVRPRFSEYQRCVLAVCLLLALNSVNREYWIHPFNEDVHTKGEYFSTYPDLLKYPHKFFRTYRMSIKQIDALLHHLRPVISKQDNNYQESIGSEERLVITLR